LRELCEALTAEEKRDPAQRAEANPPTSPNIAKTAALHGSDLLGLGFSIDEVVHDYGDVCQAVTELAVEFEAPVSVAEFHSAWTGDRETDAPAGEGQCAWKDDRLRRLVGGSIKLFELLRAGQVAPGGSTAMVLGQNLGKMRAMLG
jgi:hypothetical protein